MFPRVSIKHSTQNNLYALVQTKQKRNMSKRQTERPSQKIQVIGSQQFKDIIHDRTVFCVTCIRTIFVMKQCRQKLRF